MKQSKALIEVLSPVGENLGLMRAKVDEEGLATIPGLKNKDGSKPTFKLRPNSQFFHRKKKQPYYRWVRGTSESLPREAGDVEPIMTDTLLDMVAHNRFARDAMDALNGRHTAEKIQAIVLWVLVGVLVIGLLYIGSSIDQLGESIGKLAPTPTVTGSRP
jgi:hypothetical protein